MDTQLQISLPENTLQLIDTFISNQMSDSPEETQKERIKFIYEAIQFYLVQKQQNNLKQQLKEGAIRRAERDLSLAEEWFNLEEEASPNS